MPRAMPRGTPGEPSQPPLRRVAFVFWTCARAREGGGPQSEEPLTQPVSCGLPSEHRARKSPSLFLGEQGAISRARVGGQSLCSPLRKLGGGYI